MVKNMKKVELEELNGKGFEEGRRILLEAGYVDGDVTLSNDSNMSDYIEDTYFVLEDEDGEATHEVSFERFINRLNISENDDRSGDVVVKEGWNEL